MNILILYDQYSTYTNTVHEHLSSFAKYSKHNFAYCHGEGWVPGVRWGSFDAVVIHYSLRVAFNSMSPRLMKNISKFSGIKILFVQDEYDFTERTRRAIETLGIDVVYTCIPNAHREKIYSTERFPNVRFIETLTGFTPDSCDYFDNLPISKRTIVCGYRGRALPHWYGDLGQEKQIIAEGVRFYCSSKNISCDIQWDDSQRIYGKDWLNFLSQCKSTLGTESGSNLFDYDGSLRRKFDDFLRVKPDASYLESRNSVLGVDFMETQIMNQVSPRIFEAINCGTALILFEGEYSGVIKPYEHFLPLSKDFSNLEDIFKKLEDDDEIQLMVDRAYDEVVRGGRYSFPTFIFNFDLVLDEHALKKNCQALHPLAFSWEVRPNPVQTAQASLPGWLSFLWHSIPLNIRLRMKPLARRAWDFYENKLCSR